MVCIATIAAVLRQPVLSAYDPVDQMGFSTLGRFLMVNCWSLYLYATMDVITIGAPSVHIRAVKKIKL